jgi:flagellar FliL protein
MWKLLGLFQGTASWGTVAVIGAAGLMVGGMVGLFSLGKPVQIGMKRALPNPTAVSPSVDEGPGVVVGLERFTVNVGDKYYLSGDMLLHLSGAEAERELRAALPQIRSQVLLILSSQDPATLRTVEGQMRLRDQLTVQVNTLLPHGGARKVYFQQILLQ